MRPKFVLLYAIFAFCLVLSPYKGAVCAGEPVNTSISASISATATVVNPIGISSLIDGNNSMIDANHEFVNGLEPNSESDNYRVLRIPENQDIAILINNECSSILNLYSGPSEEIQYISVSDIITTNHKNGPAVVITIAPIDN